MANYSVKQIAEMLNTNPETVRRWIRAGRLQAVQESKKEGNVISEEALKAFLEGTPKYAAAFAMAVGAASAGAISMLPGIGLPIGLAAGIAAGTSWKKAISEQNSKNAKEALTLLYVKCVTELDRKQAEIERLESEIEEKQQQVQELKDFLSKLEEIRSAK